MDLSTVALFYSFSPEELREIEAILQRKQVDRGELVVREGEVKPALCIVENGQIEVFRKDPMRGQKTLRILKVGDYFGEETCFNKTLPRAYSARSIQTSTLLFIDGVLFHSLLTTHPALSIKLLAQLTRIPDTEFASGFGPNLLTMSESKVISVSSVRDGYGKTTFATSLAFLMAAEIPHKRFLYLDLDLRLGNGNYFLGTNSPNSIYEVAQEMQTRGSWAEGRLGWKQVTENLFGLFSPHTFLDAERLALGEILNIIKLAKKEFHYIIVDTASILDNLLLNVFDISDFLFFLIDFSSSLVLRDNLKYFQTIKLLKFPPEKVYLLGTRVDKTFAPGDHETHFPYRLVAGLHEVKDFKVDFGKTIYQHNQNHPYCQILREIVQKILKEVIPGADAKTGGKGSGFFHSLFQGEKEDHIQTMGLPANALYLNQVHPRFETSSTTAIIPSEDIKSLIRLVRHRIMCGHLREAKNDIYSFMEFSQQSSLFYELLGLIFIHEEVYSEAVEAFQQALALDPGNSLAKGFLGSLTGDEALFVDAQTSLTQKIKEFPKFPDVRNDYGKVLLYHREYNAAEKNFREALEIHGGFLEARINLATALAFQQKYEECIKSLIHIKERNARIYMIIGQSFLALCRFFHAQFAFRRAYMSYPDYPGLREHVENLQKYFSRLNQVIHIHEKIVQEYPSYPDLKCKLGNFFVLAGRYPEAKGQYDLALKDKPGYAEALERIEFIDSDPFFKEIRTWASEEMENHPLPSDSLPPEAALEQILKSAFVRDSSDIQVFGEPEIGPDDPTLFYPEEPMEPQAERAKPGTGKSEPRPKKRGRTEPAPRPADDDERPVEKTRPQIEKPEPRPRSFSLTEPFKLACHSPILTTMSSGNSSYRFLVSTIVGSGKAEGVLSQHQPNTILFEFHARPDQPLVLHPNDSWMLRVLSEANEEVFSYQFTIEEEDIKKGSKSLSIG